MTKLLAVVAACAAIVIVQRRANRRRLANSLGLISDGRRVFVPRATYRSLMEV